MVGYQDIKNANSLINDSNGPRVAVFAGGTSGIGKFTITELVKTGTSITIYLIGRKRSAERMQEFIAGLHIINAKARVIWTEGDISLLSDTKRVCEIIKANESRVDLAFLSAGYAPMGNQELTPEGYDVSQALEYYTRILIAQLLLPLMAQSSSPRVVFVGGGGMEQTSSIKLSALDLSKAGAPATYRAQSQCFAMGSVALEKLAEDNPDVTFVHSWPGFVNTGNAARGVIPGSVWSYVVWGVIDPLMKVIGIADEESGQRHLFESTSAAFGGSGVPYEGKSATNTTEAQKGGLFLVRYKCDAVTKVRVMSALRGEARTKVWDHTQDVLGPYL